MMTDDEIEDFCEFHSRTGLHVICPVLIAHPERYRAHRDRKMRAIAKRLAESVRATLEPLDRESQK